MRYLILLLLTVNCYGANIVVKDAVIKDAKLRTTYTDYCADPDCVLCMRFNQDYGYVVDESGEDNHGTVNGATYTATGCKEGKCYDFDGVDDYIVKNSGLSLVFPFTMCAWVKLDVSETSSMVAVMVCDKDATNYWHFIGSNSGNSRISSRDPSYFIDEQGSSINDGEFHFLCGIFTNTDRTLYLDGNTVADITEGTNVSLGSLDRTAIGRAMDSTPSAPWNNKIDEVIIFNRALTAAEIRDIYENGLR